MGSPLGVGWATSQSLTLAGGVVVARSLRLPFPPLRRLGTSVPLYHYLVVARIAQLVEQLTLNQLVPGSNPGAGIKF